MIIFKDRQAAGKLLAERLNKFKDKRSVLVLGIPRGGVVVAKEIARSLNLPLDIVVTRKIGAPFQSELALGAVDPAGQVIWHEDLLDDLGLKIDDLKEEIKVEVEEIKRRELVYRQGREPLSVKGKIVLLVDDGIATGATAIAAIKYLKSKGAKKIIVAVPVAAKDVLSELGKYADEIISLHTPDYLGAVGSFYQNFLPVLDKEVVELLAKG